jgi:hypothetical protein
MTAGAAVACGASTCCRACRQLADAVPACWLYKFMVDNNVAGVSKSAGELLVDVATSTVGTHVLQ